MKRRYWLMLVLSVAGVVTSFSQSHFSQWIMRNATDTTMVRCLGDSFSAISFPPNCMGMGMMYPDSLYCQYEALPMDSLHHPFDSTFLCWRRLQLGSDSTIFNYLRCDSGYGSGNYMMGFQRTIGCRIHWDSTLADSMHWNWHPTGVRCWDGTRWVMMAGVSINGSSIAFASTQVYSSIAVIGQPNAVTGVEEHGIEPLTFLLEQNYPNPFNPTTTIAYQLPTSSWVRLKVYDMLGREIRMIVSERQSAGYQSARFDAGEMPSGVYFYRLQAGAFSAVGKMMLTR